MLILISACEVFALASSRGHNGRKRTSDWYDTRNACRPTPMPTPTSTKPNSGNTLHLRLTRDILREAQKPLRLSSALLLIMQQLFRHSPLDHVRHVVDQHTNRGFHAQDHVLREDRHLRIVPKGGRGQGKQGDRYRGRRRIILGGT